MYCVAVALAYAGPGSRHSLEAQDVDAKKQRNARQSILARLKTGDLRWQRARVLK
jgi:hypothetical protein